MNENEIERIAAAANALRPDWPLTSLRTLLNRPEIVSRPRRDVAVALAWVACETETKTPARVLESGPWWRATNDGPATHRPPRRDEECPTHAGSWRDSCTGCASDRLAGTTTDEPDYRKGVAQHHLTQARAELAAVRARCCSHGVERGRCREEHDETEPSNEENA